MGIEDSPEFKELADFAYNLPLEDEKFVLEGAPFFSGFSQKDKKRIIGLFVAKAAMGELEQLAEDRVAGIEKTAKLYHSQNLAFQEVLMKEGFEPTQNVARDYDGRIAGLTYYSTFMILGKLRENGRHITMSRAHSINSTLNCNGCRGTLKNDLKIGEIISLSLHNHPDYKGSPLRGLAINPQGADSDELETHTHKRLLTTIGYQTCLNFDEIERELHPKREIRL